MREIKNQKGGVIYFLYGFGEHMIREEYEMVYIALTKKGFIIHAMDLQGHGKRYLGCM